jgi:alkylhydroperoxidase/carboxymuconolactone decarboxylase family protein YurZ
MLDVHVWEALEAHGVTEEHMAMLLKLLAVQRNGSIAWHFVHGQLSQCDCRITFPSRRAELARVSEAVR